MHEHHFISDKAAAMVLLHEAIESGQGVEAIRILNDHGYGTGRGRGAAIVDWSHARQALQRIVTGHRFQY
ncbi:MAG: hypothetical protein H6978_05365 [Gammaproteobacteria bacterium]|nr:hypothetical protein [Gammaproteobacteria bacterium]